MRDRGLVLRNVPPLPHLAANFSKRALVFRNVPYFARFETAVLLHRFDSSFEVLTGDQVDDFNAVGQETEEKAEIDADALLDNGFSALQAFSALEGRRIAACESSQERHRAARDMVRELTEPFAGVAREIQ